MPRRAQEALRQARAARRGDLVPALLRAGRRRSDLAGLRTRAERRRRRRLGHQRPEGLDHGRALLDYGILVTRTDPNVPKHKGLTMFFLDMKAPGRRGAADQADVGRRQLQRGVLHRRAHPRQPAAGRVGDGWKVALTTLMNERLAVGAVGRPRWTS